MTKIFLIKQLTNIENAKRINRERVVYLVLENAELMPYLVEIMFASDSKISIKAAWVLELVCEEKLEWIVPHLNYFTENIHTVLFDSVLRPVSKICNFLAIAYTSKNENLIKKCISTNHIENIIEAGFDWMISKQKVAVKAYTMNALYLFGKDSDWVHHELKIIIQQNIATESAAYKARGKMTLALINKK